MKIRVGYDLNYDCAQPVPMIVMLNIHYSRASDLIQPDRIRTDPRALNSTILFPYHIVFEAFI
jgi:hypothetical protein